VGPQQPVGSYTVAAPKRRCCFDRLRADTGAVGDSDVGCVIEQLVRARPITLRRGRIAQHRQRPAQQRRRPIGAVPNGERRNDLVALRQPAERQQRTTDADFGQLGQNIVSRSALRCGGRRTPSQKRFEVLVDERPRMVDEWIVRLAVAIEETLEAITVL
jgi:hypothetical protein